MPPEVKDRVRKREAEDESDEDLDSADDAMVDNDSDIEELDLPQAASAPTIHPSPEKGGEKKRTKLKESDPLPAAALGDAGRWATSFSPGLFFDDALGPTLRGDASPVLACDQSRAEAFGFVSPRPVAAAARYEYPAAAAASSSHARMDLTAEPTSDDELEIVEAPKKAPLHVTLPDLVLTPEESKRATEYNRQLKLQVDALNKMTADQWLTQVLLNRMKTKDAQIDQTYGLETGRILAAKIETVLRNYPEVATHFLKRVIKLMAPIKNSDTTAPGIIKMIEEIEGAANRALVAKYPFQSFERDAETGALGLENLSIISRANLGVGLGRQHGDGDESDFRKSYEQAIEHLKKQYGEGLACLHNPDQCIGGHYRILWDTKSAVELTKLRNQYNSAVKERDRLNLMHESLLKTPNTANPGLTASTAADLIKAKQHLTAATSYYIDAVNLHVGSNDVNSRLGKMWMESITGPHINRVHFLLTEVLKLKMNELKSYRLNITANVKSVSESEPIQRPEVDSSVAMQEKKIVPGRKKICSINAENRVKEAAAASKSAPHQTSMHSFFKKEE